MAQYNTSNLNLSKLKPVKKNGAEVTFENYYQNKVSKLRKDFANGPHLI